MFTDKKRKKRVTVNVVAHSVQTLVSFIKQVNGSQVHRFMLTVAYFVQLVA